MSTITESESTRDEAIARAERIRTGIESYAALQEDIAAAYHRRDWSALGYDSWDTYVAGEFGEQRLKLSRQQRQEIVAGLRGEGLSTRAIGAALGVGQMTVVRDLSGESNDSPDVAPITGTDGKSYAAVRPTPAPASQSQTSEDEDPHDEPISEPVRQQTSRKTPLPKFAADTTRDLWRLAERLGRIIADQRFAANRESIRQQCQADVNLASKSLQSFRDALGM